MNTYKRDIKLIVTDYIGTFFYKDTTGRWRMFNRIGNAEVAMQMLRMFEQVGHHIELVDKSSESLSTLDKAISRIEKENAKT